MCRVLSYLGKPILVEKLLYEPDNSFIKQSYNPKLMPNLLNLAGFGLVAWDPASYNPATPFIYKTPQLPFYDQNLRNLTQKITPNCILAHVRGVTYNEKQVVSKENVHPFLFPDVNIVLAHNGILADFANMKYDLLDYIPTQYSTCIQGTTDSEWIYALFISQLMALNSTTYTSNLLIKAVTNTLKILKDVRYKHQIQQHSPANLFITDGQFVLATRFVFDFGNFVENSQHINNPHTIYHSLWYTYGESYEFHENHYQMASSEKKSSIIIASEPLTTNTTTWIEVPQSSIIAAHIEASEIKILIEPLYI
jgi:glutamine amidotransferase